MAEEQDVNALKRRGRRRLVGAVALVLLAVIVLPMVFDPEPRGTPPVSVRIPSEDDPAFKPKPAPKVAPAPEAKAPAAPEKPPAPAEKPPAVVEKPPVVAEKPVPPPPPAKKQSADEERKRAEAALANVSYYVQVAALADAEKLKELTNRLAAARLPYYTESVATAKGKVTRVRVGPFDTKDAAQQASDKLKGLGLAPGRVTAKS